MRRVTQPAILIVEGIEDQQFFEALIQHLRISEIQVMPIGGKTQLSDQLAALRTVEGFSAVRSLGIVRDADNDFKAAFQSVRHALQDADLPVPDRPLGSAGEKPSVTVMILPDNNTPGMLEDLCLRAVATDPAMICVEQYFECLKQQAISLPKNPAKAKIQAFLASRPEAGKRLGEAAQAGYWPWHSGAFEQVKDFLQKLASSGIED